MDRFNLLQEIDNFTPFDNTEANELEIIKTAIKNNDDIYSRKNIKFHITVSAWVVNKDRTKVLFAYHNIYKSWAWLGGHADENENLAEVAVKEATEESGIDNVRIIQQTFISAEILDVKQHIKRGETIKAHKHLNFTYLLEADETLKTKVKADENSAVGWLTPDEIMQKSTEHDIIEKVYKKLFITSKMKKENGEKYEYSDFR